MAGMRLSISGTVIGDDRVVSQLGVVVANGSDFRPAWTPVSAILIKSVRAQFRMQGWHSAGGWRALSDRYRAWKARKYPGKTILKRTDRMWSSLVNPGDSNHLFIPAREYMMYGTLVPYASYHQEGTDTGLPKREIIRLRDSERRGILKRLQSHIIKNLQYQRVTL